MRRPAHFGWIVTLLLALTFAAACSDGPEPSSASSDPAATDAGSGEGEAGQEEGEIFEDDFESGEPSEWAGEKPGDNENGDDSAESPGEGDGDA